MVVPESKPYNASNYLLGRIKCRLGEIKGESKARLRMQSMDADTDSYSFVDSTTWEFA